MGQVTSGIFCRLFAKQQILIHMFGLDGAGKTAILYRLVLGKFVDAIPTIGFNVESVEHRNICFTIWDVNGQYRIRELWKHYCLKNTKGLIFVVDSHDRERIDEAKCALLNLLREDNLKDAVLLVLANKQDLPNALSVAELTVQLDLNSLKERCWHVQTTNAVQGHGLYEALDWLCEKFAER